MAAACLPVRARPGGRAGGADGEGLFVVADHWHLIPALCLACGLARRLDAEHPDQPGHSARLQHRRYRRVGGFRHRRLGHAGRWPSTLRIILLSPLIVPPIIYAVGMVRLWSKLSLLDSWLGVTVVHVILAMPLAVLAIGASLSNLDPRLVQAARSLGARPPTVFGRVILPNILPGTIAGAILAFIVSWDEITVTLFITSRRLVTLPRKIWTSIADAVDPALAAIATVMLVITIICLLLRMTVWERLAQRRS